MSLVWAGDKANRSECPEAPSACGGCSCLKLFRKGAEYRAPGFRAFGAYRVLAKGIEPESWNIIISLPRKVTRRLELIIPNLRRGFAFKAVRIGDLRFPVCRAMGSTTSICSDPDSPVCETTL